MSQLQVRTKDVLKIIATGGLVFSAVACPAIPIALASVIQGWENINKRDLNRIITRLEKQDMISISEVNGKTSITITDKGNKRLLQYDYEQLGRKAYQRDGKWRMIIFDIPEKKKKK